MEVRKFTTVSKNEDKNNQSERLAKGRTQIIVMFICKLLKPRYTNYNGI